MVRPGPKERFRIKIQAERAATRAAEDAKYARDLAREKVGADG